MGEFLWSLLGHLYEPILKLRHDRWRAALPAPSDLGVPLLPKVALVLVFQPRGIAASLLVTLRHLVEQGYAPLVISNAPVSQSDRARLFPMSWRLIERPNFGYDFGGYRDGILLLQHWGVRPERLIVMNDSIWMPLAPGSTLIARMETASGDIIGGIEHPDVPRRSGTVRAGFIESYLYLVNRTAWDHPAFCRFWQGYRLSSNKMNAVYRGERGFSRRMRAAGLSVRGLFAPQVLLDALKGQETDALRLTLQYAAYTEPDLKEAGADLLAEVTSDWPKRVLDHVRATSSRRRFSSSFPWPSLALLQLDLMKKSAGPSSGSALSLHSLMRRQYLRAVEAGDLPIPYPEVLSEIESVEGLSPQPPH
ncbi:MAG: rhamnan synthesis F family protein [Tabrizicola sp.]|nr:rhamnan synthesis F family protein [Tabrizicola sp.]